MRAERGQSLAVGVLSALMIDSSAPGHPLSDHLAEVEDEERCELPIHHQELGREAL